MAYSLNDDNDYPRMTQAVQWLLVVNVAVYFVQLVFVGDRMWDALGFTKSDFANQSWWSLGTYMFVHGDLVHLAVNMFMLWVFGPRLEHTWGTGRFVRFYLWCGLGGLVAHLLISELFGGSGALIGASAALMGVMLGWAITWPEEEVFLMGVLPMKVKWLVTLLVAFNLAAGLLSLGNAGGGVAYFAHLGGVAFGWLFILTPAAGSLERIRHRVSAAPDETDEPPRAVPRSLPRNRERMSEIDEIIAKSNAVVSRRQSTATPPRKAEGAGRTEALDYVLDKISERGLESLTPAERKLLEDVSRELRRQE